MENNTQLSLVMQTPVEELIPKLLAWNGEELLAAVKHSFNAAVRCAVYAHIPCCFILRNTV